LKDDGVLEATLAIFVVPKAAAAELVTANRRRRLNLMCFSLVQSQMTTESYWLEL